MGGAVGPALAAAVCNAGGLGMPVLWRADADTMRQQIREMHTLTSRPFGVNLVLDFPQEERLRFASKSAFRSYPSSSETRLIWCRVQKRAALS